MPRRLVLSLTVACLVAASPAAARERWLWPVRGSVIGRFQLGPDRFAAGQRRGIDIAAPLGAPVRAACSGRVSFTGTVGASGRVVAVACGPLSATYLHLARVAVRRGAFLAAGEPVGTVGASGRPREATPHLSLGARVRVRAHGYVDPLRLLEADPPGAPPALPSPRPGRPPGIGPPPAPARAPLPVAVPAPLTFPSSLAAAHPARVTPVPSTGLPLGPLWPPAGFALLIGAFALTALRRLRASSVGVLRADRPALRHRFRPAARR